MDWWNPFKGIKMHSRGLSDCRCLANTTTHDQCNALAITVKIMMCTHSTGSGWLLWQQVSDLQLDFALITKMVALQKVKFNRTSIFQPFSTLYPFPKTTLDMVTYLKPLKPWWILQLHVNASNSGLMVWWFRQMTESVVSPVHVLVQSSSPLFDWPTS